MDSQSSVFGLVVDVSVLHALVVSSCLLDSDMSEAVPLGAALGVEGEHIVVADDLERCAFAALLEVDYVVFERFASGSEVVKEVEAEVQLDGDAGLDFLGGGFDD